MKEFNGYDKDELFKQLYYRLVNEAKLPLGLYYRTYKQIISGVEKGFGKKFIDLQYNEPDYKILEELQTNVYLFSGAKTFQQIRAIQGAMVEGDKIIAFNDFRKKADKVFGIYNESYLKAEYNTAIGNGQIASKWAEIEETKELFPMLRYEAHIDKRTSDICRPLNGITLPVGDPFWNKYMPLNHFNCRCTVIKIDKYSDDKPSTKKKVENAVNKIDEEMRPEFKINAGKDKLIFSYKHPYFTEVPKKYKEFAKTNFGLPIPQTKTK